MEYFEMSNNIKVVILCGGMGTRIGRETEIRPKPMVKIGNKPILWHILKIYASYGFKDFILCLGYKGDIIKEYFSKYEILNNDFTIELGDHNRVNVHSNHAEKGWHVTLVDTGEFALKGARIKRIEKYIEEDLFMLTYGDGLADININDLLSFHQKLDCIGTITGVRPPSRFGELVVDGDRVVSFSEKPQASSGLISGGFFVFNRKILDYLTDDDSCDFEIGPLERLAEQNKLMMYDHTGQWACMDTLRDVQYLNKLWRTNQAFWKCWKD